MLQKIRVITRLGRLDTSLLAFLSVFLPIYSRTNDQWASFSQAIPLLFISICAFIANDLDDIEKDKINHPQRPLPKGEILPASAAILYFISLFLAMALIKANVEGVATAYYFLLLILVISYHYLLDYLPSFKSGYVAFSSIIPILIVSNIVPGIDHVTIIAISIFLLILARELCMDILDREGDLKGLVHRVGADQISKISFALQAMVCALLFFTFEMSEKKLAVAVLTGVTLVAYYCWWIGSQKRIAIFLMKSQLFVGLYLLV